MSENEPKLLNLYSVSPERITCGDKESFMFFARQSGWYDTDVYLTDQKKVEYATIHKKTEVVFSAHLIEKADNLRK